MSRGRPTTKLEPPGATRDAHSNGGPKRSPSAAVRSKPRGAWIAALTIVACVALVYADSLPNEFVFDDNHDVLKNQGVLHPWPLWSAAVQRLGGRLTVHPRPVVVTSFALNYAIGGARPWVFRATNIVIHALAALALFGIVRRTLLLPRFSRVGPIATQLALVTALVWAVHPLTTQAVAYITQRYESLMGLFYLLTLYCALRGFTSAAHPGRWKAASVVACGLAMGSKEVAVTAPLFVLLYDRTLIAGGFRRALANSGKMYAGFALLWLAFAPLYRSMSGGSFAGFAIPLRWWQYAMSQPGVILHYLRLCVLPAGQCFDALWPPAESIGQIVPAAAAIGALLAVTCWGLFKNWAPALLGAAVFLILSITSSVVPIADLCVEHRMYLPLAAVVTLLVVGGYWLALDWQARRSEHASYPRWAAPAVSVLVIGVLGAQTALRNLTYQTPLTLWQDTVDKAPENSRALYSLAHAIYESDRDNRHTQEYALSLLEKSLAISPRVPDTRGLHGLLSERLGNQDQAQRDYREAIQIAPDKTENWCNYGGLLQESGRNEEAIACFDEAIRCDDKNAAAYGNRAIAAMRLNRPADAARDFERAISLDASHPQWFRLLAANWSRLDRAPAAIELLEQRYPADQRDPEYYVLLGALKAKNHDSVGAEAALRQALAIDPRYRIASLALADFCTDQGRPQEAIAILQPMLQVDPRDPAVFASLGDALAKIGEVHQARNSFQAALELAPNFDRARSGLAKLARQLP